MAVVGVLGAVAVATSLFLVIFFSRTGGPAPLPARATPTVPDIAVPDLTPKPTPTPRPTPQIALASPSPVPVVAPPSPPPAPTGSASPTPAVATALRSPDVLVLTSREVVARPAAPSPPSSPPYGAPLGQTTRDADTRDNGRDVKRDADTRDNRRDDTRDVMRDDKRGDDTK